MTESESLSIKSGASRRTRSNGVKNRLDPLDRPIHDWYRFVLSYPPHLVADYISKFGLTEEHTLLDPFCGTGTTLVEAKLREVSSIGIEANPMAHFASTVKTRWHGNTDGLLEHAQNIAAISEATLFKQGIEDDPFGKENACIPELLLCLDPEKEKLLLKKSISELPLHKTLVLLQTLDEHKREEYDAYERLALAKALVYAISNLRFGPEVGLGSIKKDAPVIAPWLSNVKKIASDLEELRSREFPDCIVHHADARSMQQLLRPNSIDAVITSPPYPNEKDYTRTTRLETVLLGFVNNLSEMRALKRSLVKSNTRGVYKSDIDDEWISEHLAIQNIAGEIERRRIEMGKTSGFERLYARVTKLYFGGMAKHLSDLRFALKPGAQLAYVVGDQASYLRIMIRTGQLLAGIAESLGYKVESIDLFRTRLATATKEQLREEVVVLRWEGK